MRINMTGNDLDLTPALKEYIENHLGLLDKFLGKYNTNSVQAHVVVARTTRHHNSGDVYQAEIRLNIPSKSFIAKSEGSDVRAIFDEAKDKLKQELIRYKERETDYRA